MPGWGVRWPAGGPGPSRAGTRGRGSVGGPGVRAGAGGRGDCGRESGRVQAGVGCLRAALLAVLRTAPCPGPGCGAVAALAWRPRARAVREGRSVGSPRPRTRGHRAPAPQVLPTPRSLLADRVCVLLASCSRSPQPEVVERRRAHVECHSRDRPAPGSGTAPRVAAARRIVRSKLSDARRCGCLGRRGLGGEGSPWPAGSSLRSPLSSQAPGDCSKTPFTQYERSSSPRSEQSILYSGLKMTMPRVTWWQGHCSEC